MQLFDIADVADLCHVLLSAALSGLVSVLKFILPDMVSFLPRFYTQLWG